MEINKWNRITSELKNKQAKQEEIIQRKDLNLNKQEYRIKDLLKDSKIKEEENENLNLEILNLKSKINEMVEDIEFMKQREIERIQQLDLDEINLISQGNYNSTLI